MKHKLFILMTIFWLLLFSNCQTEEDYIEQGETHGSTFQVKRLTQIEFKRAAPKAFGKTEQFNLQQRNHAKGVAVNDFTVETDEVIQITKGDIVSYTLSVYRDEPNELVENLVLTRKPDGSYIARLVSYELTEEEKEILSNGAFLDITNKINSQLLENGNTIGTSVLGKGSSSNCFSLETHYEMCCHNVHSTLDIMNGADCTCPNPPTGYTFVISVVPCGYDGGGFGMPGNTSPVGTTGPSNGDGSGGGGGTTNPNNPQNPNPQDPEDDGDSSNQEPEDSFEEPTLPLIKTPKPAPPCEELKNITDTAGANLKAEIEWLEARVHDAVESGVAVKKTAHPETGDLAYFPSRFSSTSSSEVALTTGTFYVYWMHSHPKIITYGMFSFGDVKFIRNAFQLTRADRQQEVAVIVVCQDPINPAIINTYAMKVDNIDALDMAVNLVWNNPKYAGINDEDKLKKINIDQADKYKKSQNQLEKSFLQQFGGFGISLYKADADLNNWSKLELGTTPSSTQLTVNTIPCN